MTALSCTIPGANCEIYGNGYGCYESTGPNFVVPGDFPVCARVFRKEISCILERNDKRYNLVVRLVNSLKISFVSHGVHGKLRAIASRKKKKKKK